MDTHEGFKVTHLPDATRADMIAQWHLRSDGSVPDAGPDSPILNDLRRANLLSGRTDDAIDDGEGENGWRVQFDPEDNDDREAADRLATPSAAQRSDFLRQGGWSIVEAKHGGVHAHRGVLHPDEYVHEAELVTAIEHELGFPINDLRLCYTDRRGGPLPHDLRELRADLDRKLAGIPNLAGLARAAGLSARTLQRAAKRGRRVARL